LSSSTKAIVKIDLNKTPSQRVFFLVLFALFGSLSKMFIQFGTPNHSFFKDMVSVEIHYLKICLWRL